MRRKYFLYELKNNLSRIIVFTVFASTLFMVGVISENRFYNSGSESSMIGWPTFILSVLILIVPIMTFSFTKRKRSIDLFYSLPISKANLTFIKLLVGWIIVCIPYTISFLLGVLMMSMTKSPTQIGYYFLFYGASLIIGACIYLFVTFVFQQANTIIDGLILIVMSSLVFMIVLASLDASLNWNLGFYTLIPFYPIIHWADVCDKLILYGEAPFLVNQPYDLYENIIDPIVGYSFTILLGTGSLIGLYLQAKNNVAEASEDLTTSWFGYRTQIPIYTICLLLLVRTSGVLVLHIIVVVLSIIMTMISKRTYKLHWISWVMFGGYILVSGLLSIILNLFSSTY